MALLTTDSYRIAAYEQLKIYGKILGVAVHAVKDTDDLRLTLSALRHKHLVLIDTVGMGQRDERVGDQNEMFDATGVQCLLLLNATSGGDTLEDVVRMYRSNKVVGCIPTKLDEAVNLGTVLDVAVRHRLVMHYMANGARAGRLAPDQSRLSVAPRAQTGGGKNPVYFARAGFSGNDGECAGQGDVLCALTAGRIRQKACAVYWCSTRHR